MDCKRLLADGFTLSGVYKIHPWDNRSVDVYCDMDTEDGGWTVIQRRVNESIAVNRTWNEYKEGFGSVHSSYWIGNDVIHQLTKNRPSLYVSITLTTGTTLYQQYVEFSINNETDNYRLYLAGLTEGTLGDAMLDMGYSSKNLSGMFFSTLNRDNDGWDGDNCAAVYRGGGGGWFNACSNAYLNGQWPTMFWISKWVPILIAGSEIKETVMMIKAH